MFQRDGYCSRGCAGCCVLVIIYYLRHKRLEFMTAGLFHICDYVVD
jgi:hypothetical protein